MKMLAVLVSALGLVSGVCYAYDGDDTLRILMSKADLIVLGTITSEPMGSMSETGVLDYVCDFKISDVCKGDVTLNGKTIRVNIRRFEMEEKDHNPLIKKDVESILFLKKASGGNIPQWVTADFWFGVQHPIPWMVKTLKRLVTQEKTVEQSTPPLSRARDGHSEGER